MAWWLWLLIGSALFFALQGAHSFFGSVRPLDATQIPSAWDGLVNGLSIAILVVCIVAAALSLLAAGSASKRPARAARTPPSDSDRNAEPRMTWGQFEMLAVEAFRRRGFQITERGSSGDDGSRNLELRRGQQRFLAHCKAWRMVEVDIGAVRELYSMIIVTKAQGGFVITSGRFTMEARTFAAGRQLQLIDGQTLREMLRDDEGAPSVMPTIMPTIIPTGIIGVPTAQR
jgi:restriction system protein